MIKNYFGIDIVITKKNVKNLNLRVTVPDGKVTLSVPLRTSDEYIYNFIKSKVNWINYQRERILSLPKTSVKTYHDGSKIKIFDDEYTLKLLSDKRDSFHIKDNFLVLVVKGTITDESIEKSINKCFKIILTSKLNELIYIWEHRTGLYSTGFSVKKMRTRWGSCNVRTYKLNFNLALVNKNISAVEYVVLHELCHIKVPNHSKNFKDLLSAYMPDWKMRKSQLID